MTNPRDLRRGPAAAGQARTPSANTGIDIAYDAQGNPAYQYDSTLGWVPIPAEPGTRTPAVPGRPAAPSAQTTSTTTYVAIGLLGAAGLGALYLATRPPARRAAGSRRNPVVGKRGNRHYITPEEYRRRKARRARRKGR